MHEKTDEAGDFDGNVLPRLDPKVSLKASFVGQTLRLLSRRFHTQNKLLWKTWAAKGGDIGGVVLAHVGVCLNAELVLSRWRLARK